MPERSEGGFNGKVSTVTKVPKSDKNEAVARPHQTELEVFSEEEENSEDIMEEVLEDLAEDEPEKVEEVVPTAVVPRKKKAVPAKKKKAPAKKNTPAKKKATHEKVVAVTEKEEPKEKTFKPKEKQESALSLLGRKRSETSNLKSSRLARNMKALESGMVEVPDPPKNTEYTTASNEMQEEYSTVSSFSPQFEPIENNPENAKGEIINIPSVLGVYDESSESSSSKVKCYNNEFSLELTGKVSEAFQLTSISHSLEIVSGDLFYTFEEGSQVFNEFISEFPNNLEYKMISYSGFIEKNFRGIIRNWCTKMIDLKYFDYVNFSPVLHAVKSVHSSSSLMVPSIIQLDTPKVFKGKSYLVLAFVTNNEIEDTPFNKFKSVLLVPMKKVTERI